MRAILDKTHGMTKNERQFLLSYLTEGDKEEKERSITCSEPVESYKTNAYEIVRFMMEYGFIPPLLEA